MTCRAHQRRHGEDGFVLPMVIIALPVILAAFGLGVQIGLDVYVRAEVQQAADAAAVAAASAADTTALDTPGYCCATAIDTTAAPAIAARIYAADRPNRALICQSGDGPGAGGSGSGCWGQLQVIVRDPSAAGDPPAAVTILVREQIRDTGFVALLGLHTQPVTITATAIQGAENQ